MSELKRLMKLRENITHFTQQQPDKKIIEQILKDAHELIPVKNNMWNYYIDVWGPEHHEEKKLVALQTVGSVFVIPKVGRAFTVMALVDLEHPVVEFVKVIIEVPAVKPVTKPALLTVATEVFDEAQEFDVADVALPVN